MVSGLVWWSPLISFWWGASSTDWHWPLGGDEDEELTIFIIISVLVVEDDDESDFSRLYEKPRLVGSKNAKYFFSELLFCRTSLKIFACAWPLAIHAFDLCFKRIEKKMDRAPLPPHLHIMALFSYNNYPHLWFPLGRPGGQGGNVTLWAIASKHNEEQSKSIINHRHFIRLIETKRQICQISLCSYIFSLFASSISTTPVSAITSKQALRVKFAIEFYKSKITPDFYRLSKCPVRCLIYLCIRKSFI